jgi:hypothetical protein
MVTDRNRRTPSGNCALIPANTEVVRGWKPGIGDDSERLDTLASGGRPKRSMTIVAVVRVTGYRTMFRRSSGPLLGVSASKPKRGRLSANKGTREAHSSRVITQPARILPGQASPMRRMSGGVAGVVRDWESQSQGEGRQEVSFWTAEGFANREGSR